MLAVVALCSAVDLELVAEGIETERQRELLAALGCTIGQGYLWSRPLPSEELEAWVVEHAAAAMPSRSVVVLAAGGRRHRRGPR